MLSVINPYIGDIITCDDKLVTQFIKDIVELNKVFIQ